MKTYKDNYFISLLSKLDEFIEDLAKSNALPSKTYHLIKTFLNDLDDSEEKQIKKGMELIKCAFCDNIIQREETKEVFDGKTLKVVSVCLDCADKVKQEDDYNDIELERRREENVK